jgi:hypothetical protein
MSSTDAPVLSAPMGLLEGRRLATLPRAVESSLFGLTAVRQCFQKGNHVSDFRIVERRFITFLAVLAVEQRVDVNVLLIPSGEAFASPGYHFAGLVSRSIASLRNEGVLKSPQ